MSQQDDISALLRIIREQQSTIDDLKERAESAEASRERYQKWWMTDSDELTTLRAKLNTEAKEEQK